MITAEFKTALISGAQEWVLCGFCGKVWKNKDYEITEDEASTFDYDNTETRDYEGMIPYGWIERHDIKVSAPTICDCRGLHDYENNLLDNRDLILKFYGRLAETEILLGQQKLTEIKALQSHNDKFQKGS